ncbi:unnamed protein product [Chrysoparadoxa australica]
MASDLGAQDGVPGEGVEDLMHGTGDSSEGGRVSFPDAAKAAKELVILSSLTASLTSVLLGYDVGVMAGAIVYIKADLQLSTLQAAVIVSSLNMVAAPGAVLAGSVSDFFGRKRAIGTACLIFIGGSLLKIMSTGFGVLLFGRIITGVGVGCGFQVSPVYIAEITPPNLRGMLTGLTDICINLGIVIGYLVAYIVAELANSDGEAWRIMLAISLFPPFVILAFLAALPESPRWLVAQGLTRDAYSVMQQITPPEEGSSEMEDVVKRQLEAMQASVEEETHSLSWGQVLCSPVPIVRRTVLLGLGLGIAQQISGSESVVYYSPSVLEAAGIDSTTEVLMANVAVGLAKLLGEIVGVGLTDHTGRRPLFLLSSTLVTISLFVITVCFWASANPLVTLLGLCSFMFVFSLGMGPLTFVAASEVLPLQCRGKGVSLTVFANRLLSGLIALSFPLLAEGFTVGGTFFFFFFLSCGTIKFYSACVPETRGKTLEAITRELELELSPLSPPRSPTVAQATDADVTSGSNPALL